MRSSHVHQSQVILRINYNVLHFVEITYFFHFLFPPLFSMCIAFTLIFKIQLPVQPERKNPCEPSPCGPYSSCRSINEQAMCSCLIGYVGVPPTCRPECLVDSDCTSLMSCSNQKCIDPCAGTCGINAICKVHYHKAICYCPNGYSGDPFTQCITIIKGTNRLTYYCYKFQLISFCSAKATSTFYYFHRLSTK